MNRKRRKKEERQQELTIWLMVASLIIQIIALIKTFF
ncbi:hypothetical protein ACUXP2_000411 [Staphylococcus haemolyticus]